MRLLALFLGNGQGPACVIQPAIARQIIKACHRNLPFFFFFIKPIIRGKKAKKRRERKQREMELEQEKGLGCPSQDPLLHRQDQEPHSGSTYPWGLPNFRVCPRYFLPKTPPLLAALACTSGVFLFQVRFGGDELPVLPVLSL